MRVACTGKTYLTYQVIDNRADSVSDVESTHFGFGHVNGTGKLGYYRLATGYATVDNQPSNMFATNTTEFLFNSVTVWVRAPNYKMGWSNDTTLQAGKDFHASLGMYPFLAGQTAMNGPIDDSTNLDGSLTLNFAFGL